MTRRFATCSPMTILLWLATPLLAGDAPVKPDHTTLVYGRDNSIKIVLKGRAGNLELKSSQTQGEGHASTDYQKGSGYVAFDRTKQALTWHSKIGYTVNRLSKHIQKVAPYMRAEIPQKAKLDFSLKINSLGYGTLNFADLDLSHLKIGVKYGDLDVSFPTENQSILRETAKIALLAGDLEINQLANLRANKIKINGGVGEVSIDFGPKLLQDTQVNLDHDIGTLELRFPEGTKVRIRGTSRNLADFGFKKIDKYWESTRYHENSPLLDVRLKGPLGDFMLDWY